MRPRGAERIFEDTAGDAGEGPGLRDAPDHLRGGSLVDWRLDRLGRSLKHPIAQADSLRTHGVGLRILKEAIDTDCSTGRLPVDGEVATFLVGAEAAWKRWLDGISVAHSLGSGAFRGGARGTAGELDGALTAVHPYVRYQATDRLSAWGVLGYGAGHLTLATDGSTWSTDTSMRMAAGGARGVFLRGNGGLELAAETGAGVDLGGSLRYADAALGLTVDAGGRHLVAHEDDAYREWGASASIRLDPGTPASDALACARAGATGEDAAEPVDGRHAEDELLLFRLELPTPIASVPRQAACARMSVTSLQRGRSASGEPPGGPGEHAWRHGPRTDARLSRS